MNRFLVILLLALLFVLSGCGLLGGSNNGGVVPITIPELRVGSNGIVASYLESQPPAEVFESTDVVATYSLHNQGATSVRRGVYQMVTNRPSLLVLGQDASGIFDLNGKSSSDARGEEQFFQSVVKVSALPSQSQGESARLDVHLCYQYATVASQEVCVDTTLGAPTIGPKVCTQSAVSVSGGQGGPIALTNVDIKVLPDANSPDLVFPQATLTFTKPNAKTITLPNQYDALCTSGARTTDPHAKVKVLLGEQSMDCGSNLIKFSQGDTAKITCNLVGGVDKVRGTYVSVIRAEVDYGFYDIALKKTIQIKDRSG